MNSTLEMTKILEISLPSPARVYVNIPDLIGGKHSQFANLKPWPFIVDLPINSMVDVSSSQYDVW